MTNSNKNPKENRILYKENENSLFNIFLYIIYNTNQIISEINSSTNVEDFVQDNFDKRDLTFLLKEITNVMRIMLSNKKIEEFEPSFSFISDGIEYVPEKGCGMKIIFDYLSLFDDYTKCFILVEPDDFFIIWKMISNINNFDQSVKESISSISKGIFEFYVNYLIENEENLEKNANDFFEYSQLIFNENIYKFEKYKSDKRELFEFMLNDFWEMMKGSIKEASDIISDYIHQIIEEEKGKEIAST